MIQQMSSRQIALTTAISALKQRLKQVLGEGFTGQIGVSFHVQDGRLNTLKATSKGSQHRAASQPQLIDSAVKAMTPLVAESLDTALADKFYGIVQANYEFENGNIVNQSISTEQFVKLST